MGISRESESNFYIWGEFKALYFEVQDRIPKFLQKLNETTFDLNFAFDADSVLGQRFTKTELRLMTRLFDMMYSKAWEHFDFIFETFCSSNSQLHLVTFNESMELALSRISNRESNLQALYRQQAAARSKLVESAKDDLLLYRAIGLANGSKYFHEYLIGLKSVDGAKQWDLYAVAELIAHEYIYEDLSHGIRHFVERCFRILNHPIVAMFCNESIFRFETDELIYEFKLVANQYRKVDLLIRNSAISANGQWWSVTQGRSQSIPWALTEFLMDSLELEATAIRRATFTKPAHQMDLISAMSWIYGDSLMSELIPLWFSDWEFFNFGRTCEGCGREITHAVSAVKGRGPVCGDHHYQLSQNDAEPVKNLIEKTNSYRLLSNGSPLVTTRVGMIDFSQAVDDLDWLNMSEGKTFLTDEEVFEEIRRHLKR